LVHVSLRPLRALTRTAREVSDLPLGEGSVALEARVPDPAPGTEIGEVAEAFNHMLDHVADSFAARDRSEGRLRQFVADASHELRTPVAVIRGRAEFAQNETGVPPATADSLARIHAESLRMGELVDSLLVLARLDSGQAPGRDELDLSLLVIEAVDDARTVWPEHRWNLDLPAEPVTIEADEAGLRRVVTNLVANAARHTPAGTSVSVRVEPPAEGRVRFAVTDDGPGIDEALLPHVFERFVRGDDARSRAAGSTGLGLAIVQAVVRAHDGTVSVDSRPGRTEFTVSLPTDAEPPSAATPR
jgi:two-component system OmpR family sensor kinase